MSRVISVAVDQPYQVTVGRDLMPAMIEGLPAAAVRVAILHAPELAAAAGQLARQLDHQVTLVPLPAAEQAKTAEVLADCWQRLGAAGFTRSDLVISLGGGATTDLAGFVAATWLRGVKVVHIPTTLLAMVDAAVGGKTGINTQHGKNLVGAFHHPHAVWCDFGFLESLPAAELRQGLAEVVKCGFISDGAILETVAEQGRNLIDAGNPALLEVAARAIAVKAAVVADDFTESKPGGLGREILNYGHTLGHAIELREDFRWRHGEAISVGMVFAAELSRLAGWLSPREAALHRELLSQLGLPTTYEAAAWSQLLDGMAIDKKVRGSQLRFVVLEALGRPAILAGPTPELLRDAFHQVGGAAP